MKDEQAQTPARMMADAEGRIAARAQREPRLDLEKLRRIAGAHPDSLFTIEALLAVVDAAREYVRLTRGRDVLNPCEWARLFRALEPFTPTPPDRAWEQVDRWHEAQQAPEWVRAYAAKLAVERDLAVKAAVDATPKPSRSGWAMLPEQDCESLSPDSRREWTRDYVALVGEVVQRQFRSDQERIAELEANAAQAHFQAHEVAALRGRIAELERVVDATREYERAVGRRNWSLQAKTWRSVVVALGRVDGTKP